MAKRTINLPTIRVEIYRSEWLYDGHSSPEQYHLYVNDTLYHVYVDKEDMYKAIDLMIKNELGW